MHKIEIQYKQFGDFEMIQGDIILIDKDKLKVYRNNLIFKEIELSEVNKINFIKF